MQGTKNAIVIALSIVAIAMALYQLLYTQILIQSPDGHLITHLGFALVVVFLSTLRTATDKKRQTLIWLLLLLSLVVTGYLMIELDEILEYRTSIPAKSDLLIGTLVIIILLVGNWMIFGKTFTIVSLVAVTYLVIGRYLPAPFTVPAISYERLLMWLSVELGSGKGVYGDYPGPVGHLPILVYFFRRRAICLWGNPVYYRIWSLGGFKATIRTGNGGFIRQLSFRHNYRKHSGEYNHYRQFYHTDDEKKRLYTRTSSCH